MKRFACLIVALLVSLSAIADPLRKENVSADARWVLHLDVTNLLSTQLGGFFGREFVDKKLAKPIRDLERQFGIVFDWREIKSVTAYGMDFKKAAQGSGVLLIEGFDFAGALDAVLEKLSTQGAGDVPLEKVQAEPFPMYAAKDGVFGAPVGERLFLISKSREQLERARKVAAGQAANLTGSHSFPALADAPKGFLLAAVADGFQSMAKLPPQANGLKNAESAQVVAGEKADKVFVNVALNAKNAESATQMQQVLQGLLALAMLSQDENKDLATLVQGLKVGGAEKTVSVNLELPAETIIAKVNEKQSKRRR
jgi:hypothetical protein